MIDFATRRNALSLLVSVKRKKQSVMFNHREPATPLPGQLQSITAGIWILSHLKLRTRCRRAAWRA